MRLQGWKYNPRINQVKHAFVCASLVLATAILTPQKIYADTGVSQGIGYSGGFVVGNGFTYVRYFGPHMIQGSFYGEIDEFRTDLQGAISYARYLHFVNNPRSLLPVALKFIIGADIQYQEGELNTGIIYNDGPVNSNNSPTYFYHTGAGLGIDIGSPGKPGLVFSTAIVYSISFEEVDSQRVWEIGPLPGISLIYSW